MQAGREAGREQLPWFSVPTVAPPESSSSGLLWGGLLGPETPTPLRGVPQTSCTSPPPLCDSWVQLCVPEVV